MFSALGSIFAIKPRQAEHTDTRQGIQRHEQDYEQRHKKKNTQQNQDYSDDNATVSVEALRLFLENFVKNTEAQDEANAVQPATAETIIDDEAMQANAHPEPQSTHENVKSGQAAMAAFSYQNTAQVNESSVLFETTDQGQGPALDLSAADIRRIYVLIEDLKILRKANVEFLQIERAETFLDSLINATNKIKALIPAETQA